MIILNPNIPVDNVSYLIENEFYSVRPIFSFLLRLLRKMSYFTNLQKQIDDEHQHEKR